MEFIGGLMSDVERKNAESIAYRHDQDRKDVQYFLGEEAGTVKHDYYLSNTAADTPRHELARVAKAEHRIDDCLQRDKSEVGLADYLEVRSWGSWYHHQALALIAAWSSTASCGREKKSVPAFTFPQLRAAIAQLPRAASGCDEPIRVAFQCTRRLERNQLARFHTTNASWLP